MPSPVSTGGAMSQVDLDAQALLSALGAAPIDPSLPGSDVLDPFFERLERVRTQPAYQALAAERRSGTLSEEDFRSSVAQLVRDLMKQELA